LERDPSQSPGLQRIRAVQQAAAVAREEEKQQELARQLATKVAVEEEQRRQSRLAEVKIKMTTLIPLLEEIKDFANRREFYPTSDQCLAIHDKPDVLIQKARIEKSLDELDEVGYLEVNYAHRGTKYDDVSTGDPDHPYSTNVVRFPAACYVGVRLRVNGKTGEVELFSKHEVTIPAVETVEPHWVGHGKASYRSEGVMGHKAYQRMENCWIPFPDDEEQRRQILAATFHDPTHLNLKGLWEIEKGEIENNDERTFLDIAKSIFGLR
jgi:hypothetical protein